jgi:hypothetical protein
VLSVRSPGQPRRVPGGPAAQLEAPDVTFAVEHPRGRHADLHVDVLFVVVLTVVERERRARRELAVAAQVTERSAPAAP